MDAKPHGAEVNRHAPPRTDVLALIDEMERSVASLRAVHDELDDQRSSTASLADERDGLLENSLAAMRHCLPSRTAHGGGQAIVPQRCTAMREMRTRLPTAHSSTPHREAAA